jgi:hypothetical protein
MRPANRNPDRIAIEAPLKRRIAALQVQIDRQWAGAVLAIIALIIMVVL